MRATFCGKLAFCDPVPFGGVGVAGTGTWPAPGGGKNDPCAAFSLRARFGADWGEAEEQCFLSAWASALTQLSV